jgi:hypothetical protein
LPVLTFSLANVKRETDFFVQTAKDHGLDLHPGGVMPAASGEEDGLLGVYEPTTRAYVDFLWGTAAGGTIEDGLVLLWAMEKVRGLGGNAERGMGVLTEGIPHRLDVRQETPPVRRAHNRQREGTEEIRR